MEDHDEDTIKSAKRSKLENDNEIVLNNTKSKNIASTSKIPDDLPDLVPMDFNSGNQNKSKIDDSDDSSKSNKTNVRSDEDVNTSLSSSLASPKKDNTTVKTETEKKVNKETNEPVVNQNDNENHNVISSNVENIEPSTSNQTRPTVTRRNHNNLIRKRNYRARRISSSSSSSNSNSSHESNLNLWISGSGPSSNESFISLPPDYNLSDDSHSNNTGSLLSVTFDDSDDDEETSSVEQDCSSIKEILTKEKPKYTMNLTYEIMYREHGLSSSSSLFASDYNKYNIVNNKFNDLKILFQNRISSSRNMIEKIKLMNNLRKHRGCVNSLNFNNSGELLCTGSDDLKICIWNWSSNKLLYSFHSGHHSNVFQTKFINTSTNSLNIVSSGRDGEIRYANIPPSGSGTKVQSTILFKHSGAVHKIALCPTNTYEILTAGEDGHIVRCDIREKPIERIATVKLNKRKVPLYSIAHHPLDPEFCVSGRDQYVRIYDKRNHKTPIYHMSPEHLHDKKAFICHITCAVYNQTGTEILASYSDEDIYLFNTKCYIPGHFRHRYIGRSNNKTIKGVNFFGPNSEYVISGSDCGNIFFWDKNTQTIINWMKGDKSGIVNCLEPHPAFPILATSGLDYDAKIWAPISETYPPKMEGLEKCIRSNLKRSNLNNDEEIFDDRTFFFFVRQCMRDRRPGGNDDCPNVQNIESSSDDNDSDGNSASDRMRQLPCTTQ